MIIVFACLTTMIMSALRLMSNRWLSEGAFSLVVDEAGVVVRLP
jgi:hypothetical protein